jgi:hypothetical protein
VATLQSLTDARAAVRSELAAQPGGHRRIELMRVDKQLESLTSTHLGALVDKIGDIKTDADKVDALAGMKLALESARLSGLDAIKDLNDPKALKGPQLAAVAAEIDALFAAGSVDLGTYQATMARAYEAIVRTTENVRAFVDRRVPDVSDGSLVPNPSFMDDLVKEGPLHYARAIGQKALRVGLEAEMSAKKIINPDGVAVLNPLGRVVFDRVMMADSMSDLQELGAGRGDMCWVRKMDEKKMMAVGGIMSDFPGGYCHAAVYARGAGIAALSNPDISAQWMEFAANLKGDKLYYDDTGGRIVMMPLSEAVKQGVVKPGEAERLKPGTNREVKYYEWSEALKRYETVGQHKVVVDLERSTDVVELYNTSTPIAGQGTKCMSFEDIGKMGTAARALFGEKSLVLSLMSQNPVLKDYVPPGSAVSTLRVQQLLGDAGVLDKWVGLGRSRATSPEPEPPAALRLSPVFAYAPLGLSHFLALDEPAWGALWLGLQVAGLAANASGYFWGSSLTGADGQIGRDQQDAQTSARTLQLTGLAVFAATWLASGLHAHAQWPDSPSEPGLPATKPAPTGFALRFE